MTSADTIGLISLIIGLVGSVLYITAILRRQTHPHLFTWLVWSVLAVIGYAAQLHEESGPGTWVMGANAGSSVITTLLAIKYGEKSRTRGDWIALWLSLIAILPWLITSDPLGSVILISLIDAVAFYPTVRKSWNKPDQENLLAYFIGSIKFAISFFALSVLNLNTLLYPSAIIAINFSFIVMCLIRRKKLAKKQAY